MCILPVLMLLVPLSMPAVWIVLSNLASSLKNGPSFNDHIIVYCDIFCRYISVYNKAPICGEVCEITIFSNYIVPTTLLANKPDSLQSSMSSLNGKLLTCLFPRVILPQTCKLLLTPILPRAFIAASVIFLLA